VREKDEDGHNDDGLWIRKDYEFKSWPRRF